MRNFYRKLLILKDSLYGYILKFVIDLRVFNRLPNKKTRRKIPVIVSLTSYGRRVKSVVYYTLISLLKQSVCPEKIIVWLDDSWNIDNLPKKLLALQRFGVEYKFCQDIKSYKKLIPTLIEYPESIIVTVDDDIIYSKFLIEDLTEGYKRNGCIQCTVGKEPIKLSDGNFAPYREWIEVRDSGVYEYLLPIGAGGVLYPPFSLAKEVLKVKEFTTLAPNADDMWFWVMAKRQGTKHSYCKVKGLNYSFDALYQFLHKGSALTHSNAGEAQNDIQLKRILDKYPIKI